MNRKIGNLLAVSALAITLVACGGSDEKGAAGMGKPAARVTTVELHPLSVVLYSEMPGRTLAYEEAEVRPEVTGIIRKRVFAEGSAVEKGDPLYLIDPEPYKATYDSAKANLERAEAALNVARLKEQRMAVLRRQNSISQQDYDEIRAVYLQNKAEVAAATASLTSATINLDRTDIQAPISGLIGKSSVSVGNLLATNQANPLATIYQIHPMNVDLIQSAQELVSIRQRLEASGNKEINFSKTDNLNLPVILLLNDGTRYKHEGKLSFIDVGVDESTATMTLRAEFPNPEYLLMPGLFVRAKLQVGFDKEALLIPQKSVLRDTRGNAYVFVAEKDKVEAAPADPAPAEENVSDDKEAQAPAVVKAVAKRRPVELGATYGENWLVLSGLSSGDLVIAEGIQNVTDNAALNIIKSTKVLVPADADYLAKNLKAPVETKASVIVAEELEENN